MALAAACTSVLNARLFLLFTFHRYLAMSSVDEANGWCGGTLLGDLDENSEIYKHYAQLCEVLFNYGFEIIILSHRHVSFSKLPQSIFFIRKNICSPKIVWLARFRNRIWMDKDDK